MIDKIAIWAQGLVVAVVIGTIIEMLLPEGNSKKYIKTVIGVYILYVIISPIIGKDGINENTIKEQYEKYFGKENIETSVKQDGSILVNEDSSAQDNLTNNQIEDIYLESIKSNIISNIKQKGYEVAIQNIELELKDDEMYGMINKLEIIVEKQNTKTEEIQGEDDNQEILENKKSEQENIVDIKSVDKIEIKVNSVNSDVQNKSDNEINNNQMGTQIQNNVQEETDTKTQNLELSQSEKNELKEYINSTYGVKKENIIIN